VCEVKKKEIQLETILRPGGKVDACLFPVTKEKEIRECPALSLGKGEKRESNKTEGKRKRDILRKGNQKLLWRMKFLLGVGEHSSIGRTSRKLKKEIYRQNMELSRRGEKWKNIIMN